MLKALGTYYNIILNILVYDIQLDKAVTGGRIQRYGPPSEFLRVEILFYY